MTDENDGNDSSNGEAEGKGTGMIRPAIAEAGVLGLIVTLVSAPSPQTIAAAMMLAGLMIAQLVKWLIHRRTEDGKHELTMGERVERLEARTDRLKVALIRALRLIGRFQQCRNGKDCPVLTDYGRELEIDIAEIEAALEMTGPAPEIARAETKALYEQLWNDIAATRAATASTEEGKM